MDNEQLFNNLINVMEEMGEEEDEVNFTPSSFPLSCSLLNTPFPEREYEKPEVDDDERDDDDEEGIFPPGEHPSHLPPVPGLRHQRHSRHSGR